MKNERTNDAARNSTRAGRALLAFACCALFAAGARAQAGETVDSLTTVGGTLALVRLGEETDLRMELRVAGRKLADVEAMSASFVAHFRGLSSGGDAVVMSVSEGGSGCPALFRIVTVGGEGLGSVTQEFGDCSDAPTISLQQLPDEQIILRFPGYYRLSEEREPGFRRPPPTTWVYSKGHLREQKAGAPARRRR